MEQVFWIVLFVFAAPIIISPLLRWVAGEHAPVYEVETDEEADERRRLRKKAEDDHWNLKNLDIID